MKKMDKTPLPPITGSLTMVIGRDRLAGEAAKLEEQRGRLRREGIQLIVAAFDPNGVEYL